MWSIRTLGGAWCALSLLLVGCANPALKQANELAQAGSYESAYEVLDQAYKEHPQDNALLIARTKQRDIAASYLLYQAQNAYATGNMDEARKLVQRLKKVAPKDPRISVIEVALERIPRHKRLFNQAQQDYEHAQYDRAADALRIIVNEDATNAAAKSLLARIEEQRETQVVNTASGLKTADKLINLEFREAPLKTVFEALARASNVNFVFDKDVRTDAKVTLFLRNITVDEAMRVILSTQQLDRKLLNDNSVLVYPNNAQKQREHQELLTRSFYLVNAEAKQAQNLVRTMTKTRDIYVDDRLNMMVVRDTPEVLRLVEKLIESIDLPESEVMMEVEILEVSSSTMRELGLTWPGSAAYGLAGAAANTVVPFTANGLRVFSANPLVRAALTGTTGNSNLLANPKIRARNREKAKVQIGQKLPVFTTTTTANVGTMSSVSYLDVGLKLEVEPSIQLDGDVIIKVVLEVSSNNGEVKSADGTTAYMIGNRLTSTSLRLKDGETQVLSGLIQDDDRRNTAGIPGLSELPGAGILFGSHKSDRQKTEIIMLITPRIVRATTLPALWGAPVPAGTDVQPGAASMRLRPGKAQVSGQMPTGAVGGINPGSSSGATPAVPAMLPPPAPPGAVMPGAAPATNGVPVEPTISGPTEALAGSGMQVSVSNPSNTPVSVDLLFDSGVFQSTEQLSMPGRVPLNLGPKATRIVPFMVKHDVTDTTSTFSLSAGAMRYQVRVRSMEASSDDQGEQP